MAGPPDSILDELRVSRSIVASLKGGVLRISEQDTIQKLILPMLGVLGWNTRELAQVRQEVPSAGGGRADIACLADGRVVMFVEAKALGESIDDAKFISQAMKYGTDEGANWCVLTNGQCWAVYHANAAGRAPDKLFRRFDITVPEEEDVALETLSLLTRHAMAERAIEKAWRRDHTDRRVEASLRVILSGSDSLVSALRRAIAQDGIELAPKEIRESLARLSIQVRGSASPPAPEPQPDPETPAPVASRAPGAPQGPRSARPPTADFFRMGIPEGAIITYDRVPGVVATVSGPNRVIHDGQEATLSGLTMSLLRRLEAKTWASANGFTHWSFEGERLDARWRRYRDSCAPKA